MVTGSFCESKCIFELIKCFIECNLWLAWGWPRLASPLCHLAVTLPCAHQFMIFLQITPHKDVLRAENGTLCGLFARIVCLNFLQETWVPSWRAAGRSKVMRCSLKYYLGSSLGLESLFFF